MADLRASYSDVFITLMMSHFTASRQDLYCLSIFQDILFRYHINHRKYDYIFPQFTDIDF